MVEILVLASKHTDCTYAKSDYYVCVCVFFSDKMIFISSGSSFSLHEKKILKKIIKHIMSEIFYKFAKKIGLLKILGKKYVINKKFIKKNVFIA